MFHKGREREQDTSVLDVQSAACNEEINSSLSDSLRDICLETKQSAVCVCSCDFCEVKLCFLLIPLAESRFS